MLKNPFDRPPMTSYWRSTVIWPYAGVVSSVDSQFSPTAPLFDAPWGRTPSKFPNDFCSRKTRMMALPDGRKLVS